MVEIDDVLLLLFEKVRQREIIRQDEILVPRDVRNGGVRHAEFHEHIHPAHRFDERSTLIIHGRHEYKANVSDSPAGTTASVEHALESMEDRLRERESDLKQCHKQSVDLTKQLDHPFEHEKKLAVATKRQQEIITALDITKNQASARTDKGPEQSVDTGDEATRKTVSNGRGITAAVSV